MQKARTLLTLGIWVAILPYLGFPYTWKNTLITLTGLALVYFSYILYKQFKMTAKGKKHESFDNFSENHNFHKNTKKVENEDLHVDEYQEENNN